MIIAATVDLAIMEVCTSYNERQGKDCLNFLRGKGLVVKKTSRRR